MRKITLVCVGNLKEKYLKDAFNEYEKRISKYFDFRVIELPETKLTKPTPAEIERVIKAESDRILEKIKGKTAVILAIEGREMSSPEFANFIEQQSNISEIYFVIGGSYGLDARVKAAGKTLSFGKLTYPHQLMRVVLAEQIYRAATIINNIEYHK